MDFPILLHVKYLTIMKNIEELWGIHWLNITSLSPKKIFPLNGYRNWGTILFPPKICHQFEAKLDEETKKSYEHYLFWHLYGLQRYHSPNPICEKTNQFVIIIKSTITNTVYDAVWAAYKPAFVLRFSSLIWKREEEKTRRKIRENRYRETLVDASKGQVIARWIISSSRWIGQKKIQLERNPSTRGDRGMVGVMNRLRNLDAYPKINEDFYRRTLSGGVITLVSSIVMLVLFFSELRKCIS